MKKYWMPGAVLAAILILGACGKGGGGGGDNGPTGPHLAGDLAVPNVAAGTTFSFDLGVTNNGRYFFTDRNNKAVDVIDIKPGFAFTQVTGGFTGCTPNPNCVGANNGKSGPDGINPISGTNFIFVGDVDSVKVIDTSKGTVGQVVNSIQVGTTGFRADEGCYDPDHKIYMISSPDAPTPFASFINPATQTVIATVLFTDPAGGPSAVAAGLEQCAYDPGTQSFLVNNDGTTANPHGEVDVIPANLITPFLTTPMPGGTSTTLAALGPTVKKFPLGNCDPTGMALGPGTDVAIECRPGTVGAPLITLILNRTNGSIQATVPFGGGDQVAYDPATNQYFVAGSRWTNSGLSVGACSAANPCIPALGIIDAASRTVTAKLSTGNNAHSVAVDSNSGLVFVPYSSAAAPPGCASCTNFPNGGVSIFTSK